jgi:hypothetical protein
LRTPSFFVWRDESGQNQSKNPHVLTLPSYSPVYALHIARIRKNLRASVDNKNATSGDFLVNQDDLDIFPLVVGHESERRKRKRLRDTESDFQQQ